MFPTLHVLQEYSCHHYGAMINQECKTSWGISDCIPFDMHHTL